jgi:broad specificity phosphatase PhoE
VSALILIPWAQTDGSASGRLFAQTPLSLNEQGSAQAEGWGRQLTEKQLNILFASSEQTSRETADAIARPARIRVKVLDGLEEVDFGLWEGLSEVQLKSRFPKTYKRWFADPAAVCPPNGEDLRNAAERISIAVRKATRKGGDAVTGVVLGPIACAVARCALEGADLSALRSYLTTEPVWYEDAVVGWSSTGNGRGEGR